MPDLPTPKRLVSFVRRKIPEVSLNFEDYQPKNITENENLSQNRVVPTNDTKQVRTCEFNVATVTE